VIFVELGLLLEIVKPVIQVTSLSADNVFLTPTSSDQPLMISVPLGMKEFVLNVLIELILMPTQSVEKFQFNAPLGIYSMDYA
jgi:hypothetical protein